jgi:outer membrane autotransporter protein
MKRLKTGKAFNKVLLGGMSVMAFSAMVSGAAVAGDITVATGAKAVFDGILAVGTLTIDGTAVFKKGKHITTTLNLGKGATIELGADAIKDGIADQVFTTGVAGVSVAEGASVTLNLPSTFTSGDVILVTGDDSGAHNYAAQFAATDTALVDYAVSGDTNDTLVITATAKNLAETASELGITKKEADSLVNANRAVASGDEEALDALSTALREGGATATKAAQTVALQADTLGAGTITAISTGGAVVGIVSNRLAFLRPGHQYASAGQTDFSTSDAGMAKAVWMKPFGNWVNKDSDKGIAGFEANTYGIAGGLDSEIADGFRLGGSMAYARTEVDGKGAGNAEVDIDSYQFTAYGSYTADTYYIEGMFGYAHNNNDGQRTIVVGPLTRTADADYNSNQYMFGVSGGIPIQIGGDSFFTPTAGLAYTHLSTDSYTETGAGNWNLRVDSDDVDAIVGSLGAKFHTRIKQGTGVLIPEVRGGISYDFSGDEAIATASYTGGGAAFKTTGSEVDQLGGNLGLGLTYDDGTWSVGTNYDTEIKSGLTGHSTSLEARFKF